MSLTFTPDENAASGVMTSMYEKNALGTPPANPIPFNNGLPPPRLLDGNGNNFGHNDQPSNLLRDDPPLVCKANVTFDVIDKTLNSEMGQTALRAAIQHLGDSAASVEIRFRNVSRGLEKTLEVVTTEKQTSELQNFRHTWDKHHKVISFSSRVILPLIPHM